jgi:hypothetical protein
MAIIPYILEPSIKIAANNNIKMSTISFFAFDSFFSDLKNKHKYLTLHLNFSLHAPTP